jgi:ribulose-5-phosphate 4-epimerase/fuculose-1-phosphate aldolase
MMLRNHGTLALGKNCADAFLRMFYLERACSMQVRALAGGARRTGPTRACRKRPRAGRDGVQRHGRRARLAGAAPQMRPRRSGI